MCISLSGVICIHRETFFFYIMIKVLMLIRTEKCQFCFLICITQFLSYENGYEMVTLF